jgi:hypothetical protein
MPTIYEIMIVAKIKGIGKGQSLPAYERILMKKSSMRNKDRDFMIPDRISHKTFLEHPRKY